MLALNKKVGLLSIQSAKSWRVLYFDQRGVTPQHNLHRILDRVVAALVRAGRLTETAVDEVREHAARMGQPLTDSLLAGGYLDAAELEDQYRTEIEEDVYDLFFCREAKFEFHEGAERIEGCDGIVDQRFFFNCDSVIMEAARRIDEWTYISERVPTTAEVFVATAEQVSADDFGNEGPPVFELLDGRRNVARVVELTGLSNFQVCKVLSQMLDGGAIAPVAAEELLPMASECMAEGRLQDAICLYERAVGLGVGVPQVHSLAATAYQAAEEYEHAIYHLECEAEHRVASGDKLGAAKKLFEVKQLVPTDLQARERLVDLTLGEGRVNLPNFEPLAEGKQIVDLLLEFGDIKRVRALLERLLLVEPEDPDLKKALVNVHVKAGDQKRVTELYESIAEDLVRQGKPIEAVAYLQKILIVDRSRTDISERVRKLYEFDERARRRSRLLSALAVLFLLLMVGGVGYWFYNDKAEEDFARIDIHGLMQSDDFAGAAAPYREFIETHPLTTSVAKAEAELQQIDAAQKRFEARLEAEHASRLHEQAKMRDAYLGEWAKHRDQFLAGHPEDSLAALDRVKELVAKAGTAEDMQWALEQQVERTWVRLREFLAEAATLAERYDVEMAAGNWQAARTAALRLRSDFDSTASARRAQIPVFVKTRPAGAALLQDGKPILREIDGKLQPVTTPTLVLCPSGAKAVSVTAARDGFEPRQIVFDAASQAEVEAVLAIIADRRITFASPAQTGVGVGDGWLAVGLRGGRLGLARTDGSAQNVVELDGLRAVDGTPVIHGGRAFFVTNDGAVDCVPLDRSVGKGDWPRTLTSGVGGELAVADGRVCILDHDLVLHCWEQASATLLWAVSLDCALAGPPTLERRLVYLATTDGRLLTLDAADGKVQSVLRSPAGITSRILASGGKVYFAAADGNLRAVDASAGKILWTVSVGRTVADGEMAIAGADLLVAGRDDRLFALDLETGRERASVQLGAPMQRSIQVQGSRALVQVRRPRTRQALAHDVLLSIHLDTMSVQWEFADQAPAPGVTGVDGLVVALPTSTGDVVLFR